MHHRLHTSCWPVCASVTHLVISNPILRLEPVLDKLPNVSVLELECSPVPLQDRTTMPETLAAFSASCSKLSEVRCRSSSAQKENRPHWNVSPLPLLPLRLSILDPAQPSHHPPAPAVPGGGSQNTSQCPRSGGSPAGDHLLQTFCLVHRSCRSQIPYTRIFSTEKHHDRTS